MESENVKIRLKDRITITVNKKELEIIRMALYEIRSDGTKIEHKRKTAGKMYEKVRKIWNSIITDDSEMV